MLFASGLVCATVALGDVRTDKPDYSPGDTVYISGDGMEPGETVRVDVFFPGGEPAQRHYVVADDAGNFEDTYVLLSGHGE